jgi:hypothetical protein
MMITRRRSDRSSCLCHRAEPICLAAAGRQRAWYTISLTVISPDGLKFVSIIQSKQRCKQCMPPAVHGLPLRAPSGHPALSNCSPLPPLSAEDARFGVLEAVTVPRCGLVEVYRRFRKMPPSSGWKSKPRKPSATIAQGSPTLNQ